MADPIVYDDSVSTVYDGGTRGRYYVWKPGSQPYNEQQVQVKMGQALDNWGSLSAAQKDILLRVLVRHAAGRFDGV